MCDGYAQCDDESDEDPDLCNQCPKENGWPRRPEEKRWRATFKCKHRYTNRAICATPCDGIDDMCLDYADEDNCKIPSFHELLLHVALVTLTTGIMALGVIFCWTKCTKVANVELQMTPKNIKLSLANKQKREEKELYHAIRSNEKFGVAVQNFLLFVCNSKDITMQQEECTKLFELEVEMHEDEDGANIHIMKNIGTYDSVGRWYDLLDESISVGIETFLYHKLPHPIYNLIRNHHVLIFTIIISNFLKITLYYTDLYKDAFLAYIIYSQVVVQPNGLIFSGSGSFPTTMLLIIVFSICATEVLNCLTLVSHPEFSTWKTITKIVSVVFSPLVPAYMIVLEAWNEIKVAILINEMSELVITWENHLEGLLTDAKKNTYNFKFLALEFRANDNSIEHFSQLTVIVLIILFSITSSPLFADFDKVFINVGSNIVFLSALMSICSLVIGPVAYLSSRKNGFLGIVGTLILIPYYAIGAATRLFLVLLLFCPSLGIFDTMSHYTKGIMDMDKVTDLIIYQPDTSQTYYNLWEEEYRIKYFSQAFTMSSYVVIGITTATVILHLTTSFSLFRPIYNHSGDGLTRQFLRGIHTLVNPPLFCDWEEFYRNSNFSMEILNAWHQSKKLYAKFQALFFIEHLLFLMPMVWLKIDVERRNAVLEGSIFKPVHDEILSSNKIDLLLTLAFVVTFLAPLLQAGLAYAYFRYGHPWNRVWRVHVLSPTPEACRKMRGDLGQSENSQNTNQFELSPIPSQSENHGFHEMEDPTHTEEDDGSELAADDEIRIDYSGDNIEALEMTKVKQHKQDESQEFGEEIRNNCFETHNQLEVVDNESGKKGIRLLLEVHKRRSFRSSSVGPTCRFPSRRISCRRRRSR